MDTQGVGDDQQRARAHAEGGNPRGEVAADGKRQDGEVVHGRPDEVLPGDAAAARGKVEQVGQRFGAVFQEDDVGVGLRERVGAADGDGDAGAGKDGGVVDAVANHQGVLGIVRFEQRQFGGRVEAAVPVGDAVARGKAGDVFRAVTAGDGEVVVRLQTGEGGGEVVAFGIAQLVVGAQFAVFGEVNVGGVGVG